MLVNQRAALYLNLMYINVNLFYKPTGQFHTWLSKTDPNCLGNHYISQQEVFLTSPLNHAFHKVLLACKLRIVSNIGALLTVGLA